MKSVVITGCCGFIGTYVTKKFLENGYRVCGIDKMTYAANKDEHYKLLGKYIKTYTFLKEDICDLKRLPDCDFVINLAAETHVGNSIIDCKDFIKTNVDGVRNLLELISRKPKNIRDQPILVNVSTDEVYGDIEVGHFYESNPLNPSNPYAASKASGDLLIKSWARTYGLKYNIIRPTNNYGNYQYPEKLVPLCVKLLQEDKKIKLHNKGNPVRSWLHAEDTAEAILTVVEKGKRNEVYNVAGNEELKNMSVTSMIVNSFLDRDIHQELTSEEKKKYFDLSHVRPGQDVRYAVNQSKLIELGYKPKKYFEKEIKNIVEHYKNNYRW